MAKKPTRKSTGKSSNKKKRTISGVKKKNAKEQRSFDPRGVIGLVVLCVGLLAFFCQFTTGSGNLLAQCKMLMRGLGGMLCLLLPMVIIFTGCALVFFQRKGMNTRTIVCCALIFVFVETLLQLFEYNPIVSTLLNDGYGNGYGHFLLRSYKYSSYECTGGGLIGALLAWPLCIALDVWGGLLVLVCAIIIALMVLTGISFSTIGNSLSEWLDDLRMEIAERREENEALREKEEEERVARERERAEQRKKQREEREAREAQRREAEIAEAEAAAAAAAQPQEPAQPAKRRTKKQTTAAAQGHDVPPAAPRKSPFEQNATLYIEQDDELFSTLTSARSDNPMEPAPGADFTIEEAEEAFLYGINEPKRRRAARQAAQARAAQAEDVPASMPQTQEEAGFDSGPLPQAQAYEADFPPQAYDDAYGDADADDQMPDAEEELDWSEAEYIGEESFDVNPDEEDYGDVLPPPVSGVVHRQGDARPEGVPSSIPASGVRAAAQRPAPRSDEAAQEKTIVQLRGSRLDGTPVVMPKKDPHEAPSPVQEYIYPPIDLLERGGKTVDPNQRVKDEERAQALLTTLESFNVVAALRGITHGPAITRYELQPGPGVKVSRITNLAEDIALNMAVEGVRIAPVPGKPYVGIEVPNDKIEMVSLRDILESREMTAKTSPTLVALGKGISGLSIAAELSGMPHVLIAGATGSGKSVCINTILCSIIFRASPEEVRLILIDPKVVELSVYNGIPHLLIPVVTDPKKASAALSWAVVEMEHRYKRFETMGVRDIKGYNNAIGPGEEKMSKIIVVIDELADLMMVAPGEVEESICRLAQLARAAGIHLVIATQRPSVNVITGVIKANIPSRIAFAVSSQIDSRTILDAGGAEKLLGKGDMLYAPQGQGKPTRVQGCFVSDDERAKIINFVKNHQEAEYSEAVIQMLDAAVEVANEDKGGAKDSSASGDEVDEMLYKAIDLAVESGQISISMIQRRLRVGYARAGRLIDEMTLRGFIGEAEGPTKPRSVLISREEWNRMKENME